MSGYWDNVPRGNWIISDTTDAFQALTDIESRCIIDKEKKRIYVYGPEKRSVLIDLNTIFKSVGIEGVMDILHKVEELTGERFNLV